MSTSKKDYGITFYDLSPDDYKVIGDVNIIITQTNNDARLNKTKKISLGEWTLDAMREKLKAAKRNK